MPRRTQGRFRKRPRLNIFGVAFVISLLFHLSMVTVFQVVILFPRTEIRLYKVDIVQAQRSTPQEPAQGFGLEPLNIGETNLGVSRLIPDIDLPTIEFAELERLKVRQHSQDEKTRYESLYADQSDDSWARFGTGMQQLGRSIRDVTLGGLLGLGETQQTADQPTFKPAEGYSGFIEWNDPNNKRKLLFSPPMKALWKLNPAELNEVIELVFEVNHQGRVINVYSPNLTNQELLDDIQLTVLQYRFEPLAESTLRNQLGVIQIKADTLGRR